MAARCPVCGATGGQHRQDCLYRARTPERRDGPRVPILLVLVFWAAVAATVITFLGAWPATLHALHQLAHGIAPGLVGP